MAAHGPHGRVARHRKTVALRMESPSLRFRIFRNRLEPDEGNFPCPVLRGRGPGDRLLLPDWPLVPCVHFRRRLTAGVRRCGDALETARIRQPCPRIATPFHDSNAEGKASINTSAFDPLRYKAVQRHGGKLSAALWKQYWAICEQAAKHVNERLVELAHTTPAIVCSISLRGSASPPARRRAGCDPPGRSLRRISPP